MIYLDHAATTPLDSRVLAAMEPYLREEFGNPSSMYKLGRTAARAIFVARQKIAAILNCEPGEIIFTAGGTESDNLAIFGVVKRFSYRPEKYHVITTAIEHSAVLEPFKRLEKLGFKATYLSVDKYGLVDPENVMKSLRPETILVSIVYANNEIGMVQNIAEIAGIIKNYRHIQRVDTVSKDPKFPLFHTDACQAAGYLDLNVQNLGVDLLTLNSSKVYGPKQVGLLYKNKAVHLSPLLFGGDQEFKLRPGTENVAGIAGFARALELAEEEKAKEAARLIKLRDYFTMELLKIPHTVLNGHHEKRLPNNVNVSFLGIEGESILLKLEREEIYVSTGSACHSTSLEPSHVMLALDSKNFARAHGSIRFTLGRSTAKKDLDCVLKVLPKIVGELRKMSAIG